MEHHYGLITGSKETVPLKSISVTLSINDFVAAVAATLNYENEENVPIEAVFVFPMDEDSAVYNFEALVDGKKIVAELQDKMMAHKEYEDALSQGHQAYLLEEDDYSRDVFSCNVGNLEPGAKVAITLRYVQELPLERDGALRYLLPAILNPRYQLTEQSKKSCLNIESPIVPLKDLPYTLSMIATITSQHGIERVQSNCSLSPIQYLTEDKTSAQVSLTEGHKFDRDVELLIYYSKVHSPSVAVEMGMLDMKPDCLMGASCAMVSFYPDIPEVEASKVCGEFVFLVDRSGSMDCPMSTENKFQTRIEVAKETLLLLLKSLPMGCYFNIYGFGSSYEKLFPESVKYTEETMEDAVKRVKSLKADLGGTEILKPLCNIYKAPSIPGHPLQAVGTTKLQMKQQREDVKFFRSLKSLCDNMVQVFVFTDGEVSDTFSVIREVQLNSKKHRCFSFGIGQGASTTLIKNIAQVSGGIAEFIMGKDRMQTKALGSLKFALQCAVDNISLSWDLPPGLTVKMLSPEHSTIFRGQRLIIYAQLTGIMPQVESTGTVCLKHTLQGKQLENKVTFSLQPKANANFTIHRLAAKFLIQTKDLGLHKISKEEREDVVNISLQSGVLSSFTAFIAINKELNKPVQGPLTHRVIPRPLMDVAVPCLTLSGQSRSRLARNILSARAYRALGRPTPRSKSCTPKNDAYTRGSDDFLVLNSECCGMTNVAPVEEMRKAKISTKKSNLQSEHKAFGENVVVQLISLQKANGSWKLDEDLTKILGTKLKDIKAANPVKHGDLSAWATVLAVVWLHTNGKDLKCEWELLERKAVAWLHDHAGSSIPMLLEAANNLLKLSVNPAVFEV